MIDREKIRRELEEAELFEFAETYPQFARECVLIRATKCPDELPLGISKIGGLPDLPDDLEWPIENNRPLMFLTQIDLEDLADFNASEDLPSTGILSFFSADCEDGWRVFHFPKGRLTRRPMPELNQKRLWSLFRAPPNISRILPACDLEFRHGVSLPKLETLFDQGLMQPTDGSYFYAGDFEDRPEGFCHQILGYPHPRQRDMERECEFATNGIGFDDPRYRAWRLSEEFTSQCANWQLLLEFDSDDDLGYQWGDGTLYYWIRRADLKNKRFEKVRAIFQFY